MCLFVLTIWRSRSGRLDVASISGLVVEYIVATDVTRVRFPADALFECHIFVLRRFTINKAMLSASETQSLGRARDNDHDHISLA